jgi:GNAT superfamily N-acetyltransferase
METREVIARRLARDPRTAVLTPAGPVHLLYELLYARQATTGALAAVRDQTAILPDGAAPGGEGSPTVVVHLSHVLVAPPYRGSGLAGWLRAWPIATARTLAAAVLGEQAVAGAAITLVGEMEHGDPADPATTHRLTAYEKAGFLKIDPAAIDYWQPDFRDPATIDADGHVRPIPIGIVLRRVGREVETTLSGREVQRVVSALYGMYAADFRPQDMAVVYDHLAVTCPPDDAVVKLLPPTTA